MSAESEIVERVRRVLWGDRKKILGVAGEVHYIISFSTGLKVTTDDYARVDTMLVWNRCFSPPQILDAGHRKCTEKPPG